MTTYPQDAFDEKLAEIIDEQPASNLLSLPGVYEILSEHFNNDVLVELRNDMRNPE